MAGTRQEDVLLGILTTTQGIRGELRIDVAFDDSRVLRSGQPVVIAARGLVRNTVIDGFRKHHGRAMVRFAGIGTIEEAESLVGAEVLVRRTDVPEPKAGEFYTFTLRGCVVETASGAAIGSVTDVEDHGGAALLRVEDQGREVLIPFAKAYVLKVDIDRKRIVVDLPEGLRELNC